MLQPGQLCLYPTIRRNPQSIRWNIIIKKKKKVIIAQNQRPTGLKPLRKMANTLSEKWGKKNMPIHHKIKQNLLKIKVYLPRVPILINATFVSWVCCSTAMEALVRNPFWSFLRHLVKETEALAKPGTETEPPFQRLDGGKSDMLVV